MCLLKHTELQLASCIHTYIHTYINETHSLAPLQDLIPILWQATFKVMHHNTKVGIKSCRGARACVSFVHIYV